MLGVLWAVLLKHFIGFSIPLITPAMSLPRRCNRSNFVKPVEALVTIRCEGCLEGARYVFQTFANSFGPIMTQGFQRSVVLILSTEFYVVTLWRVRFNKQLISRIGASRMCYGIAHRPLLWFLLAVSSSRGMLRQVFIYRKLLRFVLILVGPKLVQNLNYFFPVQASQ